MTPATQEQIEAACLTRSAADAAAYLTEHGFEASVWVCIQARRELVIRGERPQRIDGRARDADFPEESAAQSCRIYLRRLLQTGHHHISDPARMASALREAGMVPA